LKSSGTLSRLHTPLSFHLLMAALAGTTLSRHSRKQFHALFTELLISRGFVVLEAVGGMPLWNGSLQNRVLNGEVFLAYLRLLRVFRIAVLSTHLCHRHVEGLPEPIQFHNGEIWLYLPYETLKLISGIAMLSILMLFIKSNLLRG